MIPSSRTERRGERGAAVDPRAARRLARTVCVARLRDPHTRVCGRRRLRVAGMGIIGRSTGWLCRPPHDADGDWVPWTHKNLWRPCGGGGGGFCEATTLWDNPNE